MQTLAPNPPLCTQRLGAQVYGAGQPGTRLSAHVYSLRQRSTSNARSGFTTFVLAACKYIFHAARVQTGARDALAVFIRQEFSYGRGPQTGGTLKPANAYRRFAGVDGGMQRQELCLLSNRQSVVTVGN